MLKLRIDRIQKSSTSTIGKLYIDDSYFCDTLEDPDRGLKDSMTVAEVSAAKIHGNTAIPAGTYTIDLNTVSPRFKDRSWAQCCQGKLPRLNNVKGFTGVLIHVGNAPKDTSGCILVGNNNAKDSLVNSVSVFQKLMKILSFASDVTLTIG